MSTHRHLSSEEIFERLSMGETPAAQGCDSCETEMRSLSLLLAELKRADAEGAASTEWDDLLMRRRIREAVARERPHGRSLFDRFFILRPVFVSAVVASIVLVVWSPLATRFSDRGTRMAAVTAPARLPSWTPLPDESEDEGLAVLAEWTPNEDEVAIARCHFACLSGLSEHEEENLQRVEAVAAPRPPLTHSSPL